VSAPLSKSTLVDGLIRRSLGIYRSLLWIYPRGYRDEYGADLVQAYRDLSREVRGLRPLLGLWIHVTRDLFISAWTERLDARRNMMEMWKRVVMGIGAVTLAISLLFVGLNILEYELGIAISWNPFNSVLDSASGPARYLLEGLIVFGPLLAIGAFLLPHLQFRWKPSEEEIAAIGIRRLGGLSLLLTALAILVLLILGIYLVGENLPCILGERLSC
jgi:hypothetical protein